MKRNSCEQANCIDLVDYLGSLGHEAVKIRNNDYWYLSPFRDEKEASFKVNRKANVWYDHGLGKGGTLVAFGILYYQCTVKELLAKLSENNILGFTSRTPVADKKKKLLGNRGNIVITDSRFIADPSLLKYLEVRKIPLAIAQEYCSEIDFDLYGKKHTAIGFKNRAGGYEIRNVYFKGSSSPKDVTLIKNKSDELFVFEGFFNFLSFHALPIIKKDFLDELPKMQNDFLILNSLSFFEKSRDLMEKYSRIHLYLDRDNSGIENTAYALKWSERYLDDSTRYECCKDFNEYLVQHQEDEKNKIMLKE